MSKPLKLKEFRALMRVAGYRVRWRRADERFDLFIIDSDVVGLSIIKPQTITTEWVNNTLHAVDRYKALMRRAGYEV